MFDLDTGLWLNPSAHMKQRRRHRVPLSAAAVELVKHMKAAGAGPYISPGADGKALTDLKRTWLSVCQWACLAEQVAKRNGRGQVLVDNKGRLIMTWRATARVHDLRHTYASILASQGLSLPIIGVLLGHTQTQTTERYAHLLNDPLRAATERAVAVMTARLVDDHTQEENKSNGI